MIETPSVERCATGYGKGATTGMTYAPFLFQAVNTDVASPHATIVWAVFVRAELVGSIHAELPVVAPPE